MDAHCDVHVHKHSFLYMKKNDNASNATSVCYVTAANLQTSTPASGSKAALLLYSLNNNNVYSQTRKSHILCFELFIAYSHNILLPLEHLFKFWLFWPSSLWQLLTHPFTALKSLLLFPPPFPHLPFTSVRQDHTRIWGAIKCSSSTKKTPN